MTLLLDAAAVVDLLVRSDRGEQVRTALAARDVQVLFTVAHVDAEVFSALARQHSASPTTPLANRQQVVQLDLNAVATRCV